MYDAIVVWRKILEKINRKEFQFIPREEFVAFKLQQCLTDEQCIKIIKGMRAENFKLSYELDKTKPSGYVLIAENHRCKFLSKPLYIKIKLDYGEVMPVIILSFKESKI